MKDPVSKSQKNVKLYLMSRQGSHLFSFIFFLTAIILILLGSLLFSSGRLTTPLLKSSNVSQQAKNLLTEKRFLDEFQPPKLKNFNQLEVEKVIETFLGNLPGNYAIIIKSLESGEEFTLFENKVFHSASLYKLAVMWATYQAIEERGLDKETLLFPSNNSLPSMKVAEALEKMITVSDNHSAILLAQKLGWEKITQLMHQEGLTRTSLIDYPQTTAKDIAKLLEKVYLGQAVNKEASKEMLDLLLKQRVNDRIPKYLPEEIKVAHKTGELDTVRHDAGIVFTPNGGYILVVLTDTIRQDFTKNQVALLSQEIYNLFEKNLSSEINASPQGLNSEKTYVSFGDLLK
jgi:beta-lactamase class A